MQETSKLGAFTVLKRLGEGPHGTSYQVRQGRQKSPKLLKLLNRGEDDPAELPAGRIAQLQAEVERFAIDHPNLVPLSSGVLKDEDVDRLYLLSDFIDGPDLYRFTARAAWTTILEVIVSILRGLETLHGAGVLHGHIAASNVIVFGQGPRKSARLLDPGLGRHVAETRLMGSQLSWAPEVLLGEAPDRRSDLYDLGVLLFECATRSPLFASDDEEELREAHLHEAPRHAREIKRSVPLAVDGLIDALLQKDPAARPPSANALIRELNRKANKRFTTENRGIYLARPLRPRFVAREAALEAIESPTQGAVEGVVPAVLVLTGDAGSGRTRLLAEARRRLCQGETPPTWIQPTEPTAPALLRALAEVEWSGEGPDPFVLERPYLQRIAPGLGASDRVVAPLEPTSERQRVLEALGQLVRGRAATPLILVVDDLHLADPLLIDMIRLLARDLWDARSAPETEADDDQPPPLVEPPRDANLRVITTLAPDEAYGRPAEGPLKALLGERGVVRHDVAPLASAELEGILATALGRDAQEVRDLTSRIASATSDPLRALHLLGELATLDALPPPDGAWTVDDERVEQVLSSTGLSAILERRLSAEGTDAARALAQLLAIHGGPLPLDLAARALDISEVEVVGQALVLERIDLVRVEPVTGPIALRSFAVTDTLQAEPSPALHGALGRAAADLAVEDPDGPWVTIAAAHLLRAEAPRGGVPFALVAARQLLESCQPTRAVELLEPALRALDDPSADGEVELAQPEPVRRSAGSDLRVACQATLAEAQLQLDRAGAARASAQKAFSAARSARDARGMIQSLLLVARASLALDDTVQAKTSCEEAAQLAQGGSWKKGLALALHQRGKAEARAGDRDEALSSFEEARGIYAARNDERELAEVLRDMARLRNRRGDPTGAEQALQQALDLDEDGDRGAALARTQLRHADLLRDQGKLDEALSIARRATRQASDVLDLVGAAGGLTSLAETLRIRGELSAARRHEEAALSLWERIGDSGRQAEARLRLGRIQLELGLLDTAEANLNAAAATFKQLRDRLRGARVTAALGDAYLLRGDLSRAGDSLDRALAEAKELGETQIVHQAQCSRARLSFLQGDLAAAEETATAVAEEAARHNHDQSEIAARVVLGLTRLRRGRPQEAERELRDAFELARDRGEGALAARARLAIAQVHLIRGEPAGALAELGQARNIAQRLENAQLEVESLMALGQLHLFLGQVKRAVTLLEMGGEHIGSLGLSLSRPEANVLLAQAVIDQAALSEETPDPALLLRAEGLLDQTEQDTLSATRRRLRTALDITRARLLLLRNDPTSARERAEAALEASKLTGDALHGVAAELLIADARDHQGRHEEALASAERAVSAAEAIRDGEARAAALLKRGRARQKLGQTFLAAQDIREAASHIRGIWASLSEDLREDYQNKPLVREIIEAAGQISQLAEDGAPEEPLPSMPLPSAPLPPEVAKVPLAEVPPTTDPNAANDSLESLRDPLTNLYNHTFFTAQLETEIKRGNRHSRPLALLKINIDRFKLVRELYGPKTAKKIIRDVAGLLMRNVRDVDIVARYFGDEFEVLLPDTDQHGALLTAKRIGDAVEEHRFEHDDEKIELTLTIGVALFPRDAKDRDALICRVDEALYNARSRGSGSVFSFGADDDKTPVESSPELRELDQLMLTREGRTILSMVSRLVNQELNIDRVIELVTGMVVEATRGERGFILLQGHEGGFSFRHGRNIDDKVINSPELKISNSIAKDVSISGEAVMVSEAIEDGRFRDFKSVMDLGLRSILCAPIKVGDNILGVIYVDHNQVARNFNQEDLNFLIAIADKVAIPINNSKKLRETEDRLELAEARLASQAAQLQTKYKYESIIGRSEAMQKVFKLLDRIVETNHSVVIHGESGTGKELIARAIHFNGPRKTKPFVAENCAALSDTLLEAELFGHVKGAFTGADRDSKGLFELANGGTLFLDEIGDMSERMQKKLLRVLQEGEVRPVGGKRVFNVDVRIVSASNKDLKKLVQERAFREDLYYRLNVITVNLPGLRDRRDDIVLLAEHFIKKHSQSGHDREVDRETLRLLMNYDWPGNVRELENEINRLVAMSDDHVTPDLLSPKIREGSKPAAKSGSDSLSNYYNRSLKEVEHEFMREIILHTLEDTNWHRTKAAKILKVPTSTLFNKMKKYGIG